MNWNRKYRPTKIAGLHLSSVRDQLQSMLQDGSLPQALLFAGPKGTGKTSTARIIGALLNDPANEKAVEAIYFSKKTGKREKLKDAGKLNRLGEKILRGESYIVQEMDAASNRGIDDIRALKERIMLPPQEGKMSVYILDEAHMLTNEAFNALLKILEEPPNHVVFILATTELHKIPGTISSRCHILTFKKASKEEITDALSQVLKNENIKYDQDALEQIAAHADGSFRDAIKLLEVASGSGKLTTGDLEAFITSTISSEIKAIVQAVIAKNASEIAELFEKFRSQNIDEQYLYRQLMETLHRQLHISLGVKEGEAFVKDSAAKFLLGELLKPEMEVSSPIPHLALELKLLEIIDRAQKNGGGKQSSKKKANKPSEPLKVVSESIAPPTKKSVEVVSIPQSPGNGSVLLNDWHGFVDRVSQENSTVAALLRSAEPISANENAVSIGVYYQFHQEQLSGGKIQAMTQAVASEFCGGNIDMSIVLADAPPNADLRDPDEQASRDLPDLAQVATEALM